MFSMVRKNKTPFRPCLGVDNTLPGVLTVQLATEEPCHKFEPAASCEESGKWEGNREHRAAV